MTPDRSRRPSALRRFLDAEASGGYVLMAAAALGLLVANSPFAGRYFEILATEVGFAAGPLHLVESVQHWINDGLMALFFLLVGLELKREVLDGQLSRPSRVVLPGVAAVGGVALPALIYLGLNLDHPAGRPGWAIPSATDIAFALGVLALLGDRVPSSLKLFLTAIAIMDDLAAILIIAVFYTAELHWLPLGGAGAALLALVALNRMKVLRLWPYLLIGVALWWLMLESGVHATLAGVALALTIPLRRDDQRSPLHRLEHALHAPVAFGVVPLFGFANAGVALTGLGLGAVVAPVSLGVAAGLFLGKQLGVFAAAMAMVRLGFADMPKYASTAQLYGVSVLCGVGFTMSLFIGALAFGDAALVDQTKIGVMIGSGLSALLGYVVLRVSHADIPAPEEAGAVTNEAQPSSLAGAGNTR